jgi:hypothetical protein
MRHYSITLPTVSLRGPSSFFYGDALYNLWMKSKSCAHWPFLLFLLAVHETSFGADDLVVTEDKFSGTSVQLDRYLNQEKTKEGHLVQWYAT